MCMRQAESEALEPKYTIVHKNFGDQKVNSSAEQGKVPWR